MADPYIDPKETLIYGKFSRDQMKEVCIGRIPALDGMVKFAIQTQTGADDRMMAVLAKQPNQPKEIDSEAVLMEARDSIVRFGSHLDSIKGRPVSIKDVFDGDAPSVLARRRLVKLTAAVSHIRGKIEQHKDLIRDVKLWRAEFESIHKNLEDLTKQQQASKVKKVDMGPEVAAERERWLTSYSANKSLIRGLLLHAGKIELMPLIFDDLAEVHRASGVSDEAPPEGSGTPQEPNPDKG